MSKAKELTGRRCERCEKPVEQNQKRTRKGHADCNPELPVLRESY